MMDWSNYSMTPTNKLQSRKTPSIKLDNLSKMKSKGGRFSGGLSPGNRDDAANVLVNFRKSGGSDMYANISGRGSGGFSKGKVRSSILDDPTP